MIVTLISQCEKKAIKRTRQILDAFANRIGDNVWQTLITQEGLNSLKTQLRRTATKSTAVACHWIRSRTQTELLWIVGNRDKFNDEGFVPVNITTKKSLKDDSENDWKYLPAIQALTAIAALLHDLGKASAAFQRKLINNQKTGEPYRHEWLSVWIFSHWIESLHSTTDIDWLKAFSDGNQIHKWLKDIKVRNCEIDFSQLPPIAQLISCLVLSHHKLPNLNDEGLLRKVSRHNIQTLNALTAFISSEWGYHNAERNSNTDTVTLSGLSQAHKWQKELSKWSRRAQDVVPLIEESMTNGCWRLLFLHSHLSLTLGDHYFSSLGKESSKPSDCLLYANTEKNELKQKLDNHLLGVCKQALEVVHFLPHFTRNTEAARDLKMLAKPSPGKYQWQDKAVLAVKTLRETYPEAIRSGFFIVNMASTGQGKTIANAKIMRALSPDQNSLRYILALGLRTLTLQTGTSYQEDIHLSPDDLAVVIGSEAVQQLYEIDNEKTDPKAADPISDASVAYEPCAEYSFLDVLFHKNEEKLKAFLFKPVLCCTIDHMMPATEAVKGGRFILPSLRLLTSDLIIDEIDDFSPQDQVAIARLVHLAGMLGRRLMISSATVTPDLVAGLFSAYRHGYDLYRRFKGQTNAALHCMWVDEFKSEIHRLDSNEDCIEDFAQLHQQFVQARCKRIRTKPIKQLAYLIPMTPNGQPDQLSPYFETVKQHIYSLHQAHAEFDSKSKKRVSFGMVRMANVEPCVELSRYLLNAEDRDYDLKVLTYHSREVLLLRNSKENYLDTVLQRKASNAQAGLQNELVREHLAKSDKSNVIFLVVCSPVEEVGRDHDFDWAIIEPSSMRSIIQTAGRVMRHRELEQPLTEPNIGILQFNIKAFLGQNPAFVRPGFESLSSTGVRLKTKDLSTIIDWQDGQFPVTAIPRICKKEHLSPCEKLADLEQAVLYNKQISDVSVGAATMHGWLEESWFLTGLPQQLNAFRDKSPEVSLYLQFDECDCLCFFARDEQNRLIPYEKTLSISHALLNPGERKHLWLTSDLAHELNRLLQTHWKNCETIQEVLNKSPELGEVLFPKTSNNSHYEYIESLGLHQTR